MIFFLQCHHCIVKKKLIHTYKPIIPQVCPVFCIGMFLMMYLAWPRSYCHLFPRESQYNNLLEIFLSYWSRIRMNILHGMLIGSHYAPKCVSTLCIYGYTVEPPITYIFLHKVCLIVNFNIFYLWYAVAGDKFVFNQWL